MLVFPAALVCPVLQSEEATAEKVRAGFQKSHTDTGTSSRLNKTRLYDGRAVPAQPRQRERVLGERYHNDWKRPPGDPASRRDRGRRPRESLGPTLSCSPPLLQWFECSFRQTSIIYSFRF